MIHEDVSKLIKEDPYAFIAELEKEIIPGLRDLMQELFLAVPCLQLQQAHIDCESIIMHLESLREDGVEEPLKDIPLNDSEIHEDFSFEDSQPLFT